MSKKRRYFSAEEKVAIIREHLVGKVSTSDICDKYELHPNMLYKWQKEFFENGANAFKSTKATTSDKRKIADLEDKIRYKDGVIIELLEDHITLKKSLGEK